MRLALESGSRLGSVGLERGGELLAECTLSVRASHSETLMPQVSELLERCGGQASEIEAVVVGAGPGSFTGVRIAAALGKGLCAATGASLYAYSSLAALAAGAGGAGRACALLPARGADVFAAAYADGSDGSGGSFPDPVLGPLAADVRGVLDRLEEGAGSGPPAGGEAGTVSGWTFVGEGALRHASRIRERGGRVLPSPHAVPRAAWLLWLARTHPDAGRVASPADWEPAYVRDAGADRAALR